MTSIKKYSSPNCYSRNGQIPRFIVLHIQEGFYDSGVSWMMNPASEISSHFLVGKNGDISQLVDLTKGAWTQGLVKGYVKGEYIDQYKLSNVEYVRQHSGTSPNLYCVSIEFSGFYNDFYDKNGKLKEKGCKGQLTKEQIQSAAFLLKHIQSEIKRIYGHTIPLDEEHVIGHYQINPTGRALCGLNFPYKEILKLATGASYENTQEKEETKAEYVYKVQCGAFYERKYADALLKQLKSAGFEGFIIKVGTLYKVQCGNFENENNAMKLAQQLKLKDFKTMITKTKK